MSEKVTKTVILLSGGIDSTVLAYDMERQGRKLYGFSVDYGQAHVRELQSAAWVASHVCVDWQRINLPSIFGPNLLTGGGGSFVVPARNLVFLSLAYAYAVSVGADEVAIAVIKDDAKRFPDCRGSFMGQFYECVSDALGHKDVPSLRAPYISKQKFELVRIGNGLGVPWGKTWSCYGGDVKPCEECMACQERYDAFRDAMGT